MADTNVEQHYWLKGYPKKIYFAQLIFYKTVKLSLRVMAKEEQDLWTRETLPLSHKATRLEAV
jgi:hypothetical protein